MLLGNQWSLLLKNFWCRSGRSERWCMRTCDTNRTFCFLSEQTQKNRLIRCKRLHTRVKNPKEPHMFTFFSDEKNFDQDQVSNRRNDRWLCSCPSEVPTVILTKFSATLIVFGVVSNKGHVMPSDFFSQGLKINAAAYINVLKTVVRPLPNM